MALCILGEPSTNWTIALGHHNFISIISETIYRILTYHFCKYTFSPIYSQQVCQESSFCCLTLLSSSETLGHKGLTAETWHLQGRPPPTGHSLLSASKWFYSLKMPPGLCLFIRWAFHSDSSHDGLKKPLSGSCVRIVFTQYSAMLLDSATLSLLSFLCVSSLLLWEMVPSLSSSLFSIASCHSPWERSIVSHRTGP